MNTKAFEKIFFAFTFGIALVFVQPVFAQKALTSEQKVTAAETLYKLIENYRLTSAMKSYDKNAANAEAIAKYKVLFVPGAVIVNDIKPHELGVLTDNATPTTVEEFTSDILDYFSAGLLVEINSANIDLNTIGSDTVTISINKTTSGKTPNRTGIGTSLYKSHTEQILYVQMNTSFTEAKIVRAQLISGNIICVDCNQKDLEVSEVKYKTPFEFAMTLSFDGNLSSLLGNSPVYEDLNYDRLVAAKPKGGFSNKLGYGGGANLAFDLMFSPDRNVGLSVQVGYSHQVNSFTLNELHLEYTAVNLSSRINDPFFDEYLRYNSVRGIKETVNTDNAGVSLLFKYQSNPVDAIGYFFEFGPTYYFFNQSVSSYTAVVDHEAIYQPEYKAESYDASGTVLATDWKITKDNIRGDINPETYFANLRSSGYDVYINKDVSGKSVQNKFALSLGGTLAGGVSVKISKQVQFLAGVKVGVIYYSKSSIYGDRAGKLLDDASGYNSMLFAMDKTMKINYGLTLGFKFRLATLN